MKKTSNKNIEIIIEFIISMILVEAVIALFKLQNNAIYVVIAVAVLILGLERIKTNLKALKGKKALVLSIIYSIAIAIVLVLQSKIVFEGKVELSYLQNTFLSFAGLDILRIIVLFLIANIVVLNIIIWANTTKFSILNNEEKLEAKKFYKWWLIATLLVAMPYMLYLFTYAPGAVLGDSLSSIAQGLGDSPYNNHHPVLYSMFVGVFMKIGGLFNSYNLGVMIYSVTQLLIVSAIIGYFLVWLRKHNVKLIYILLSYLFFVANTVFAAYAIIMWKDPLFCGFVFLMMLYIYDIIKQNGDPLKSVTGIIKFALLSILIAFFRNNGLYIVIGMYLILLIYFRKSLLKFNVINTIVVIGILIIQGPVYTKLGIVSPTEESLGVPMQQIARTIAYDGNITEEQREFLNKVLPIEEWKENYTPCLADSIKWHSDFNKKFLSENKGEFLKVWLSMMPGNFDEYVKAYLLDTYGFWSIETKNSYGFVDTYISQNGYGIERKDCIEIATGKSLENIFAKPDFLGSGTIFWIMILSMVLLIANKKSKYIIALFPSLISWTTIMIATPVAFSLRYVFMLAYAIPFILMLPFMGKLQNSIEEEEK